MTSLPAIMRFCPKCGKKIEAGTFCPRCKPKPSIEIKNDLIKVCARCDKILDGSWVSYVRLDKSIEKLLHKRLKGAKDAKIKVENLPEKKPGLLVEIPAIVSVGDEEITAQVKIEFTYCPTCSRTTGKYFEGTLQLRTGNNAIIKETLDSLGDEVSEITEMKNGLDVTVRNKKKLKSVAEAMSKKYGGELKTSAQLFSRDHLTSKDLYRLNVYFRPLGFGPGDIIRSGDKIVKITKLGKDVTGINLVSGRQASMTPKGFEVLPKYTTSISRVHPQLEVLHPISYQSVPVQNNPPDKVRLGEKVKVVVADHHVFIL